MPATARIPDWLAFLLQSSPPQEDASEMVHDPRSRGFRKVQPLEERATQFRQAPPEGGNLGQLMEWFRSQKALDAERPELHPPPRPVGDRVMEALLPGIAEGKGPEGLADILGVAPWGTVGKALGAGLPLAMGAVRFPRMTEAAPTAFWHRTIGDAEEISHLLKAIQGGIPEHQAPGSIIGPNMTATFDDVPYGVIGNVNPENTRHVGARDLWSFVKQYVPPSEQARIAPEESKFTRALAVARAEQRRGLRRHGFDPDRSSLYRIMMNLGGYDNPGERGADAVERVLPLFETMTNLKAAQAFIDKVAPRLTPTEARIWRPTRTTTNPNNLSEFWDEVRNLAAQNYDPENPEILHHNEVILNLLNNGGKDIAGVRLPYPGQPTNMPNERAEPLERALRELSERLRVPVYEFTSQMPAAHQLKRLEDPMRGGWHADPASGRIRTTQEPSLRRSADRLYELMRR